jgi:hypothetical protein
MSKIEWTQKTWNPLVGCTKVSAGCKNCYAMRMAWRLVHNPVTKDKYAGTAEKTVNGQINWTGKVNMLQDKAPLYLVQVENGPVAIAVFDCDTGIMIKIKQFMCVFGLVDIKMRMLRVMELLKIQGFPANYQMVGNQSDHKKFIGNSVHPLVPKVWAEAMGKRLIEVLKAA